MFNPISRDHSDKGTRAQEPWVDGEPHTTIRRRFIEERYRLLPYIYTLAEEASRTGLPMMRPLFMEFPDAAGGYVLDLEAGQQFMWGPAMLVAPAPYGEMVDPYPVILPPGEWYDYWTGEKLGALPPAKLTGGSGVTMDLGDDPARMPHQLEVSPELGQLPVYVRAGSIIPRQPLVQHSGEMPDGPLQLAVYPGPDCAGSVYLDDGTSFAFRDGHLLRVQFRCNREPGDRLLISTVREGSLRPWWTMLEFTIHGMARPPSALSFDGARVDDFVHDAALNRLRFSVRWRSLF